MWHRPMNHFTSDSFTRSDTPRKLKTRRTSCSILRCSWHGCERLALWTSTATGSGENWLCWRGLNRRNGRQPGQAIEGVPLREDVENATFTFSEAACRLSGEIG